jgi:hypothetical protein
MSRIKIRKRILLSVAALGAFFASLSQISASGRIVYVDPNCDVCPPPTCCRQFCRTLKLHCVYFKRSCCQKYVRLPYSGACPEGFVPPNCPTYSTSSPYPTIEGYSNPEPYSGYPGAFVR